MPVAQLGDQAGGLGTILGAVGGYLAQNPERKAKQKQQEVENARTAKTDARADAAAADTHANVVSQIADRDAAATRTKANDATTQLSQGAYQKYLPMLSSPPTADGKPLKGPALANALTAIRNKAVNEGMTDKQHLADFNTEIARVMQQNAPKLQDVEHGLPQLPIAKAPGKDGKGGIAGATPQQEVHHWMDAASRVANSDMPDEQKKTAIAMYQKNAADALARVPKPAAPMSDYQRQELGLRKQEVGIRQQEVNKPREGRTPSAQEQYFITHGYSPPSYAEANPKAKATPAEKPRALSVADAAAIDKEAQRALRDGKADPGAVAKKLSSKWGIPLTQAQSFMPDPPPGAPAPVSTSAPAVPAAKTVVGSDGHTYEQLPTGKWKVVK